MKLAILLHGLEVDKHRLTFIMQNLQNQLDKLNHDKCEVVYYFDNGEMSIEEKREWLLSQTMAPKYCFVDKDSVIEDFFILKRYNAIKQGKSTEILTGLGVFSKVNMPAVPQLGNNSAPAASSPETKSPLKKV